MISTYIHLTRCYGNFKFILSISMILKLIRIQLVISDNDLFLYIFFTYLLFSMAFKDLRIFSGHL